MPRYESDGDEKKMTPDGILGLLLTHWEKAGAALIGTFLLFALVFGGIYKVDKNEEATVRRLGAYIATVGPGLHVKVPLIDHVEKTDVTTVHRLEIGFRTDSISNSGSAYKPVIEESEMLTGDDDIGLVDFVVQYRSADARKWQFTVKEPERMLSLMAQAAMRLIVGKSPFDKVATVGKTEVQAEAMKLLQLYIDKLDFGAQIVSVQLQDVQPPQPVVAAFKDVVNAREEKERLIQQARQHANKVLPDARGQAAQIANDAQAYAQQRIAQATGDIGKFNALLEKYKLAPDVTELRLLYETQERVLHGKNVIIDRGSPNSLFKLFQVNTDAK